MERYGFRFLLAVLVAVALLTFYIFQPFVIALIMSAVFAVVLSPVYGFILRFLPRWPSVSALLTVILMLIVALIPLAAVGTQIGIEAAGLYQALSEGDAQSKITSLVAQLESRVVQYVPSADGMTADLANNISQYSQSGLRWFIENLGSAFSGIASFLVSFFVFIIALYYLLRDGEVLKEKLVALSPMKDSDDRSVVARLEVAVNSVIKGTLLIAVLQGFLAAIGFWLFGVPNSALWGTVAAISALIPGVGTALVFAPAVLYLSMTGTFASTLGLVAWGIVAVGGVDNIVRPYLIGSGTQLHPLPVLLSVLGGITFFGPVGIFLGPLSIALFFALLSIYSESAHHQT